MMSGRYTILTEGSLERRRQQRRRRLRRLLYMALALVAVGAGVGLYFVLKPSPPPPNNYSGTIDVDGQDRPYHVHLPPSYDGQTPLPVVLAFHGLSQTPDSLRTISELDQAADANGFIVVYPEGFLRVWEVDRVDIHQVDDLHFVDALLDRLSEELNVDEGRIYATGFSRGAVFVHRLACERSDRFAAFAAVAGALSSILYRECEPPRPVPVLAFHGTADRGVPYERSTDEYMGVPETVEFWVRANHCGAEPEVEAVGGEGEGLPVQRLSYPGCAPGSEVTLYRIEGGGHQWPGGAALQERQFGSISTAISASQIMWDFFARYSLPE